MANGWHPGEEEIQNDVDLLKSELEWTRKELERVRRRLAAARRQLLWKRTPQGDPRFHKILEQIAELHGLKNQDYGTNADPYANVRASVDWGMPAWVGAMVRASDKVRRLQTYAARGTLANEGVEDAFLDLATYAIIALLLFRELSEGGLPQGETSCDETPLSTPSSSTPWSGVTDWDPWSARTSTGSLTLSTSFQTTSDPSSKESSGSGSPDESSPGDSEPQGPK